MTPPFSKLLIANRGEIACRIIRTAKRMGVKTVAVYSDADRNALHVEMADEAVHIGPSAPAESYLDGAKIIAAAQATGAQAIHPGYGFLSENPDFVEAVEKAGLTFVGPSSSAIRAMGLKDAAKRLMERERIPWLDSTARSIEEIATKIMQAGESTGDFIVTSLQALWSFLTFVVLTTTILSTLDWRMGAVVAVWGAGYALIIRFLLPRLRRAGIAQDQFGGVAGAGASLAPVDLAWPPS